MTQPKPTNETLNFADLYEKAIKEGNSRFGSECKHENTKGSVCLNCLRKVID